MRNKFALVALFVCLTIKIWAAPVKIELITANESLQPGTPFWIALSIEAEEGTHFYYKDPGDSGKPLKARWFAPDGFKLDPMIWPLPKRFLEEEMETFGYEGKTLFLVHVHPKKTVEAGYDAEFKAEVDGLSCNETCELFQKNLSLKIPIKATKPIINKAIQKEFDVQEVKKHPDKSSFLMILLFAFLGGIILNVTPCVFPVISLKILHFTHLAGKEKSTIVKHGAVFSLGIILSFWTLAIIILALKAIGAKVGWGFQLQEPVFVAIMACFFFVFGLSLLDVFEFGESLIGVGNIESKYKGLGSSFISGVIATIVATPCTGPFLGTAMGVTLTMPPILVMLVFTSIALGMACPYMILSAHPSWLKLMPKQGMWMVTFKKILGFLMMAVVAWFLWVFGAQTSNTAVFTMILALITIGFGCWIYGERMNYKKAKLFFTICAFVALLIGVGMVILSVIQESKPKVEENDKWIPFSKEKVRALRETDKPIFVNFTAKWCLICQANKAALYSDKVMNKFEELGVVPMKADFTEHDDEILEVLEQFGRTGVPLYVLYPGDLEKSPIILPQILTPNIILENLDVL